MISTAPLKRTLVEKGISIEVLGQLTGIPKSTVTLIVKGKSITKDNLNTICHILQCQPCDVIEFRKSETKGHWEWIEDKSE